MCAGLDFLNMHLMVRSYENLALSCLWVMLMNKWGGGMCSLMVEAGGKIVRHLDWKAHRLKNYEPSEVLTYLQANKLICYSFMNAGWRHKTTESDKYSHQWQGMATRTRWLLCMQWAELQEKDLVLKKCQSLRDGKQTFLTLTLETDSVCHPGQWTCLPFAQEVDSLSPKAFCYSGILEKIVWLKSCQCLDHKICRNVRLMRSVFQYTGEHNT